MTRTMLAAVLCIGLSSWASAADKPKPLIFCAEPAAMPRTGKSTDGTPQGLDVAVAKLICQKLNRPFEVHWCANPGCSRRCLSEKRCDVILGHPLDEGAPKEIAWSVPYAGSQFGLVVPRQARGVRSLADLLDKRIGIVAGTVALAEDKYRVIRFASREEVLDRFSAEKLDAAFVDADFAAWHLHGNRKLELQLVADYVPREHWNLALAVRSSDAPLLVEINKALAELAEAGDLKKAYANLGVPFRPPFTGSANRRAAVDTWKRIQDRGELVISMDPANLPYSSAKEDRPGFDVDLARELAHELGLKLRIDWLDVQRETAIGELLQGDCDLALGAAVDPNAVEEEEELRGKVVYSRPYYGTGYFLVTRKDGPKVKALAELKGEKSRRLGTEAGSIADYDLRQRGYLRSLFRNQLATLKALQDGVIDYAYLWANVGYTLHATPEFALEIVPGYVPEDHWNIAIALRKGDDELLRRVDAAIEKLVKDGTVAKALAKYHVPHFPPFPEKKGAADHGGLTPPARQDDVIRQAVAERGVEPQMAKLLTSKNPYGGLERVRSAGMLIVGLDQNDLPFSSAHPKPAGLDYEIAQLIADRLGVSLQVYWGLSQHDSYPSKLATKKLCDVIMGVMPDDRFAQRVLYSKPYYVAKYQVVSRSGKPSSDVPLAVEDGIAIRGIENRKTRAYPSTAAILEAVAFEKEQAGYVIAPRSHWLAAQRWPGQLQFSAGAEVDGFPICAAVRKSDTDLKAAIDLAVDELAKSGKLAKVFARWHMAYEPFKSAK